MPPPDICFDSAEEYVTGISDTVNHALGLGAVTTFDATASIGGSSTTMTLRAHDLYIVKLNGSDIRDDAYTASKLNRDLTYNSVRNAAFHVIGLTPAGDGKTNLEGVNKDIFLISVAESLRFPMVTYLFAAVLNGTVDKINSKELKFINQWEQISRKIIAAGRGDLRACSLLRSAGAAKVTGGECRLSAYDWIRSRLDNDMATKDDVLSQLRMIDVYSCNLDIALAAS